MVRNLDVYFSEWDEYNRLMMVNFTPKQVVVQSLILNGLVVPNIPGYINTLKSIANTTYRLSPKQEAVLDKCIKNSTGVAVANTAQPPSIINPAPAVPTIANTASLYLLLKSALTKLQRPHIHVPLDLTKPITQKSDLLKVVYRVPNKYSANKTETINLYSRVGGYNEYVGDLHTDGTLHLRTWSWAFKTGRVNQQTLIDTLTELCKDPIDNTSKWGKMLSRCCYCNLPLSTPESLAVGYGDTCAKHYHLPWGKTAGTLTQAQILANAANFVPAP